MTLGITSRLFLAILATNVLIAIAFGVATQVGVDRAFRSYVESRETQRLERLSLGFANAYAEAGGWGFLSDDDRWEALRSDDRPPGPFGGSPPRSALPIPEPPAGFGLPKPPPSDGPPKPPSIDGPRRPPPVDDSLRLAPGERSGPPSRGPRPPLSLLDADRRLVRGDVLPATGPALSVPVRVEGRVVGHVAVRELPFADADDSFLRSQLERSWYIGALAILAAAIVAMLLSRGLLAPMRRLAQAFHRLAGGHYGERIAVSRKDELGQLQRDFNQLAEKLDSADATRRAFLADVSHELRTPLSVLGGEIEALQDGVRTATPEALRSLQVEVGTLTRLVDDLYELAVADQGTAVCVREPTDVAELVRSAAHGFEHRMRERGLALDVSRVPRAPLLAEVDAQRITQLVNNLLENAARYTDAPGRVDLALRREGSVLRLTVDDSPPAVPDTEIHRIFERLYRIDKSRSRALGGSGLGLALCRSVATMHGGSIRATASPLGGLRIEVDLPRSERA